jgi:hypothetical protein
MRERSNVLPWGISIVGASGRKDTLVPATGGLKSPRVGVYECGYCHAKFPSLEEFDAHAPCPAAS